MQVFAEAYGNHMAGRRKKRKKEKTLGQIIRGWLLFILLLLALISVGLRFAGQSLQAEDNSMYPAVSQGDRVYISRLWYVLSSPKRYDVVVIEDPNQEDIYYIKRVIGLPGETVQIMDGCVYVNGRQLTDDISSEMIEQAGLAGSAITLGEDSYFVLGDNRNNSIDSREPTIGNVKSSEIIGKALFVGSPLKHAGLLI